MKCGSGFGRKREEIGAEAPQNLKRGFFYAGGTDGRTV